MSDLDATVNAIERLLSALHETSSGNISAFTKEHSLQLGQLLALESDLGAWYSVLSNRPETRELTSSRLDLGFSLYAASCGMYRMAFASLRSFLEVSAFTIRMSAAEYERRRWVNGRRDLVWAEVLSPEQGLYSESYLREFCPDAGAEALTVREGMMKCYRRCSEFLHGSVQASSLLPERLVYDSGLSAEWLREAKTAVMTIHHALFVRYYGDLIETDRRRLDSCLETHLSHHRSIRLAIGLPVEEA